MKKKQRTTLQELLVRGEREAHQTHLHRLRRTVQEKQAGVAPRQRLPDAIHEVRLLRRRDRQHRPQGRDGGGAPRHPPHPVGDRGAVPAREDRGRKKGEQHRVSGVETCHGAFPRNGHDLRHPQPAVARARHAPIGADGAGLIICRRELGKVVILQRKML